MGIFKGGPKFWEISFGFSESLVGFDSTCFKGLFLVWN